MDLFKQWDAHGKSYNVQSPEDFYRKYIGRKEENEKVFNNDDIKQCKFDEQGYCRVKEICRQKHPRTCYYLFLFFYIDVKLVENPL